ncbi:MAG: hypothetical protein J3K34DRAFT_525206 [Monoraphidium minutum]|nr:MAG: hypothetical protein J3K34DRAFT_525206 [Monoraphidium minutum]
MARRRGRLWHGRVPVCNPLGAAAVCLPHMRTAGLRAGGRSSIRPPGGWSSNPEMGFATLEWALDGTPGDSLVDSVLAGDDSRFEISFPLIAATGARL